MKQLNFEGLSSKTAEEPTDQDKRLINALIQSGMNQLTEISLPKFAYWFSHAESEQYLLEFIMEQTCLEKLSFGENNFGSATTAQLISFLINSSNIDSIKELFLYKSSDFSEEQTCIDLAQLIDRA